MTRRIRARRSAVVLLTAGALITATAFAGGGQAAGPRELLVGSGGNSVRCYGGANGAFLANFVTPGSGGLAAVQNITLGPDGNLYASDFNTGKVLRYSGATGAFLGVFASNAQLSNPDQVLFGPDGNLYVSDRFTGRILKFDGTTGAFIGVFASDFRLGGFVGFTFGPDGNVYAGEFNGDDVLQFNGTTGALMGVFAVAPPELVSDAGIIFGPDGNLYVAGLNSDNVLRFNGTTGAFIDDFVPAGSGGLNAADYMVFGPDGNLYVDSQASNQVKRYNGATGAFIDTFVSDPGLVGPKGILFRPAGAPACGAPPVNHRPDCSLVAAHPSILAPADQRFVRVAVSGASDPDVGDAVAMVVDRVDQNEPVGHTSPDSILTSPRSDHVLLRAEASHGGRGRIYYVHVTASDTHNATCDALTPVVVPHTKGHQGGDDD
jgi:outer membrane protein assembly factor BamB